MLEEEEKYNPKEKDLSNYYTDFIQELKEKGIRTK